MFSHVIFLYALRPLDCPEVTALFSGMEDKTAAPLPSAVVMMARRAMFLVTKKPVDIVWICRPWARTRVVGKP